MGPIEPMSLAKLKPHAALCTGSVGPNLIAWLTAPQGMQRREHRRWGLALADRPGASKEGGKAFGE
jgi:hypothetical protein